jgi:hypothetical protein
MKTFSNDFDARRSCPASPICSARILHRLLISPYMLLMLAVPVLADSYSVIVVNAPPTGYRV